MIDESLKRAYGSYSMPKEIKDLLQLEKELVSEGVTLELIGLRPCCSYQPYSITPPDLIPFAETGGDGIHFGFLTEFGQVESLDAAPIVCVTPTNDPPIRLIARNIREFMDLVSSVPFAEFLEEWWDCGDEVRMLAESKEFWNDTPLEGKTKRKKVFTRLQEVFGTKQRNVHAYIKEVLRERASQIAIPTLDGLGVIGRRKNFQRFEFPVDSKLDESEWNRMRSFLAAACTEEKLAFIRDAKYRYIVSMEGEEPVAELVRKLLLSLGLNGKS